MTFRSSVLSFSVLSLTALGGCTSSTSAPDAARAPDALISTPDAFVETSDAPAAIDAGSDAPLAVDAGTDAYRRPADAAPMSDGGFDCGYSAIDEVVVKCGDRYRFVSFFQSDPEGACPSFHGFTATGPQYGTPEDAIASDATCDASCVYRFHMSVTRLWCGNRSGYESLRAEGCPDIYRFPAGYFDSVEAHDAMVPCP